MYYVLHLLKSIISRMIWSRRLSTLFKLETLKKCEFLLWKQQTSKLKIICQTFRRIVRKRTVISHFMFIIRICVSAQIEKKSKPVEMIRAFAYETFLVLPGIIQFPTRPAGRSDDSDILQVSDWGFTMVVQEKKFFRK